LAVRDAQRKTRFRAIEKRPAELRTPRHPHGQPGPLAAARDIRVTFARMAMNGEKPLP